MSRPEVLATTIDCQQGAVRAVRYNVDGNYCMTCGSDKTIKLWNPLRSIHIKTYTGTGNEVLDVAASSDNSQLVAGGLDRCLNILDVETGKMLRRWRAHTVRVNTVAFNEESNIAFSGSMDCTIQAFDTRSRSEKPIQILNEATDSVLSLDINGHEIVASSADSHYRIYNIRDGQMTEDFMGDAVNSVHFTSDGNCILASTINNPLRLMDKSNGKLLASYKGHKNVEFRVESAVLPSMDFVASGSEDGFAYIYGVIDGAVAARLPHDTALVHSVTAHPKEQQLLSAAGSTLYVWTPKGLSLSDT